VIRGSKGLFDFKYSEKSSAANWRTRRNLAELNDELLGQGYLDIAETLLSSD
jgi:hypothetical protein